MEKHSSNALNFVEDVVQSELERLKVPRLDQKVNSGGAQSNKEHPEFLNRFHATG
jgi:hypothetical protein